MTNVTIPQLPIVTALNGSEQLEAVQSLTSVQITVKQIAYFAAALAGGITPGAYMCTNRQMREALTIQGNLVTVDQAVIADVTNAVREEWGNGTLFVLGDAVSSFIQTTLSYTTAQMQALFTLAQAQPF